MSNVWGNKTMKTIALIKSSWKSALKIEDGGQLGALRLKSGENQQKIWVKIYFEPYLVIT